MKKLFTTVLAFMAAVCVMAQGWPENYGGVMLQGFYWDYYNYEDEMNATGWATWKGLESHASELEGYIDLIWVPNSARTKNDYCVNQVATEGIGWLKDMGYMPCWWLNHDNTIFGSAADLTSMIATYKTKGIGIIEDVVINHKNGQNDWCDFPNESVKVGDKTYTLTWSLADICYNDNGGYVKTLFDVTGAADTGTDFDGCRDLDHTGANVQQNVKTYLDYLQKELGYTGFRYDMVKGYGPQYVGIYNAYAKPTFSVGEFWDDWNGTTWWINGTKQNGVVQSAAFDFPLKFKINEAFDNEFKQNELSWQGLISNENSYKRYSVTFVDNHDTYRDDTRMSNEHHVLAANAFILSMPGTPCIFLPHWKTYEVALKRMITARKAAGITNTSSFDSYECNSGKGRSFTVHGSNGDILLLLGDCGYTPSTNDYCSVWNGDDNNWNFQMYVSKSLEDAFETRPSGSNANMGTACVDMASGTYYQTVTVNVSPSDDFTTLVYTEDGTDPTTSSNTIAAGGQASFTYSTDHTLKVGVKTASGVRDIKTYQYLISNVELADITVYVEANRWPINLYVWDGVGNKLLGDWPGKQMNHTACVNGKAWFYETIKNQASINLIVSDGSAQSADFKNVTGNVFVSYDGGDHTTLTDKTNEYAGYPEAWYAQGEVCAFFVIPNGWFGDWYDIYAYAYNSNTQYTEVWDSSHRGDGCDLLGYNESGSQIWKWTCTKNVTGQPATIIFNSGKGDNYKTEDLRFVNGAWYSAESYKGSENTEPISTAVAPSTEITLADLGPTVTATNWNGMSENVAQKGNDETMEKAFSLAAGSYIVQAIVRGTDGSTVNLSAKERSATVTLTGMDSAPSTVQTNGIVETYETEANNNGWQKVEMAFTLASAEIVTVALTSNAEEWQLGAMKVLPGTTKTKATTGVHLASNTYIDETGESNFSFYERGLNRNALIKATASTLPALLPYNVIVDGTCASLKLTDGDYSFGNNGESFTATTVSYDRSFTPGQRSTICLPFSLTAAEATASGKFWALRSYDTGEGDIVFEKVDEPLANTPYIFEAASAQPFLSITRKEVPASSLVTVIKDGVSFVGVNERQHLVSTANTTYYGYNYSNGISSFVQVGTSSGAYINPFRAYLQAPASAAARMTVLFDDEEGGMTGIQDVTPAVEPVRQQPIYNLSGQRVRTPNKKGLYIIGGKKYLVK